MLDLVLVVFFITNFFNGINVKSQKIFTAMTLLRIFTFIQPGIHPVQYGKPIFYIENMN